MERFLDTQDARWDRADDVDVRRPVDHRTMEWLRCLDTMRRARIDLLEGSTRTADVTAAQVMYIGARQRVEALFNEMRETS